jgi:sec-independent protein translocase protein TatA
MPNIGPMELVLVLIIALIVVGPKRLPDLGRSLGAGMRQFRSGLSGRDDAEPEAAPEDEPDPLALPTDRAGSS